ncbi:MAG: hypothetical protein ACLPVY_04015 [Acidimicrobiia bacterium]
MDADNPLSKAPHGAAIYQASGMVSVQANCTTAEALGMMKERSLVSDQTLDEIAHAVLERRIRFGE